MERKTEDLFSAKEYFIPSAEITYFAGSDDKSRLVRASHSGSTPERRVGTSGGCVRKV